MAKTQSTDALDDWTDAVRTWWDQSQAAMQPWRAAWTSFTTPAESSKPTSKSCCDPCRCCVPEADIVVNTRIGERRVVPFELRNGQRRERTVTPVLGPWTACDGPALQLEGEFAPEGEVTLAACSEQSGRLLINVGLPQSDTNANGAGDVDRCASAYADLRFEGCSRPVRVAVVVHPAHCERYEVDCGCGCGCS